MNPTTDEIWTAKDITENTPIGISTAYALMRSKGFPAIAIGKRYYVTKQAFYEWLQANAGKEFRVG